MFCKNISVKLLCKTNYSTSSVKLLCSSTAMQSSKNFKTSEDFTQKIPVQELVAGL